MHSRRLSARFGDQCRESRTDHVLVHAERVTASNGGRAWQHFATGRRQSATTQGSIAISWQKRASLSHHQPMSRWRSETACMWIPPCLILRREGTRLGRNDCTAQMNLTASLCFSQQDPSCTRIFVCEHPHAGSSFVIAASRLQPFKSSSWVLIMMLGPCQFALFLSRLLEVLYSIQISRTILRPNWLFACCS